ncbi:LysR family transcriptional regulator [Plastoroseomonas hellenica]|uniref:LysR family transcriptional regulator n=1 Tax=Plastoroseomonas hellenica TaxID=2687306 RepID=UPI0024AF3FC8|nr:LysR family transcriptional regulator [Plastoroseomonas hellenica]
MHPPTIRQLRCALAAFDTGSLSAASRQMGRAPATLSVQIGALEEALGARLFDRQAGGLVPTAAGRQFERIARPLLAELEAALRRIAAGVSQPAAVLAIGLRLAAPGCPAREAAAVIATELAAQMPQRHLHVFALPAGAAAVQAGFTLDACERPGRLVEHWVLAGPTDGAESVGLPELPPALMQGAAAQAAACGLTPVPLGVPPDRLDEALRPWRRPVLLPSLLLPGWLRDGRTTLRLLSPLPDGPGWQLLGSAGTADAWEAALEPILAHGILRHIGAAALRPPAQVPWPMAIEREHLDCFEAAWRHASLTRAARELGIAQPAATLRLQHLEAALGQRLFQRHPHGLTPTVLGNALAPPAAAFIQDLGRLGPSLIRPRGQVRAGCVPALDEMSLLAEVVARSAADWNQRFPDRRLHLVEGLSDELRRMVLNSSIDCAFVDNDAVQPGLVVRPITREPLVAVTAAGSGLLPVGPVPLGMLARLRLALPARHHGLRWIVDRGAARAGLDVAPDAEIDSLAATIRLVRAGGWATLLPLGALRGAVQLGALQINAISDPPLERQICLVRRHGEALTGEALALVDLFAAHVARVLADMEAAPSPDPALR